MSSTWISAPREARLKTRSRCRMLHAYQNLPEPEEECITLVSPWICGLQAPDNHCNDLPKKSLDHIGFSVLLHLSRLVQTIVPSYEEASQLHRCTFTHQQILIHSTPQSMHDHKQPRFIAQVTTTTSLNDVGPQNIMVTWWEFLNLSILTQLFELLTVILRGSTERELNVE